MIISMNVVNSMKSSSSLIDIGIEKVEYYEF